MHTGVCSAPGRTALVRQPCALFRVRCITPKRASMLRAAPVWAMSKAASLPNGAPSSASPSLAKLKMPKEARRAEAEERIAAAKTRLLAVQQRLQAQAAAAAAAGNSMDDEGWALLSAGQLVQNVMAAADDSNQLCADSTTAAAAMALASKVAAEVVRAGQAAAVASAAALGEAERQQKLLASLEQQLEAVQLEAAPAKVGSSVSRAAAAQVAEPHKKGWDPLSILLAPVAPLMAALAGARSHEGVSTSVYNKHDMLLDVLSAAAAVPEAQRDGSYDPVRALLDAAPACGMPRYDFARSLLRGLVAADLSSGSSANHGIFDMAHGLLQRVRSGQSLAPKGGSKYDPVWGLLKEAALLEEWSGSVKYDPLAELSDWGPAPAGTAASVGVCYDPWANLGGAARKGQGAAATPAKYDMLPGLFAALASAAVGGRRRQRYDPAAELLGLGASHTWQGPTGRSRYCMVAAALDAAAGWQAPTGSSRYDPVSVLLKLEPPALLWGRRFDPLGWLLDGWAANSGAWEPSISTSPGSGSAEDGATFRLAFA